MIQKEELYFRLKSEKRQIEMDKGHSDTTLKKYKIDSTERIYRNLSVKDMKINQFGEKGLDNLLPTMK